MNSNVREALAAKQALETVVENANSLQKLKAEIAALIPDFLPILVADEISGNRLHVIVEKLRRLANVVNQI